MDERAAHSFVFETVKQCGIVHAVSPVGTNAEKSSKLIASRPGNVLEGTSRSIQHLRRKGGFLMHRDRHWRNSEMDDSRVKGLTAELQDAPATESPHLIRGV